MRKIYLATQSKARKKLFRLFGLKFQVLISRTREQRTKKGLSYAQLVKNNALLKAKDAAARVDSGIIIAADTIMVCGSKIFGKPRNIKDAKLTLKELAAKPQWVYTGVAIIDKENRKTLLDFEKTKVYMDKMCDKDIDRYFAQTSPLDKAGSYDIQGKGAFFVKRIEGCFYNVVGLPLRKLYRLLKESGVLVFVSCILSCALCVLSAGCTTEYNVVTGEEEIYFYSTDKEVAMGQAIAKQVEEEYKFAPDPLMQKRVEDIGKKIAAVCDRKEIDYHFYVLDDDEVNAVSLPGGYVYINRGLIEKCDNDNELAGVISHEVGHIVARHSIKKLQAYQGYSLLRVLIAVSPASQDAGSAADAAFTELLLGYGREDELLADQLGARYSALAGYDPHGMINFLKKLQEISRRRPLQPRSYYRTHPYVPDRIREVKQELGEGMSFKDYINIEQKTHQ